MEEERDAAKNDLAWERAKRSDDQTLIETLRRDSLVDAAREDQLRACIREQIPALERLQERLARLAL